MGTYASIPLAVLFASQRQQQRKCPPQRQQPASARHGLCHLYQIHCFDHYTPIEETLEALHDVVKAGKARYMGTSSMHAWQFARALGIAEKNGCDLLCQHDPLCSPQLEALGAFSAPPTISSRQCIVDPYQTALDTLLDGDQSFATQPDDLGRFWGGRSQPLEDEERSEPR